MRTGRQNQIDDKQLEVAVKGSEAANQEETPIKGSEAANQAETTASNKTVKQTQTTAKGRKAVRQKPIQPVDGNSWKQGKWFRQNGGEEYAVREKIGSAVLSLLFSFFLTAGWQLESTGQYMFFSGWTPVVLLLLFILLFFVILWSFQVLYQRERESVKQRTMYSAKGFRKWKGIPVFLLRQGGMILCWLPVLLAGYPGFFCYDATYQFNEVASEVYDLHHPLLHTWILGKALTLSKAYLGSYEAGVLLFCVIQMLVITACFCAVLELLERRRAGRKLVWLSFFYYALHPTCVLFGLCTTKDSLFTAFVTLHLVFLVELLDQRKDFFKHPLLVVGYAGSALFAMLFRNNGIYSWLLFLPFLFLAAKEVRKQAVILTVSCMLLCLLITKGLAGLLEAEDKNGFREMLSIPAQQLARTYAKEGADFFEKEEQDRLYSFISQEDLGRYNPKLADPVKANLRVGLNSTLPDFATLWLKTAIRSPGNYLDAALVQTYQAWYPLTIPDGYCGEKAKPRYQGSESCYFALQAEEPVQMDSKLPGLLAVYEFFSRHMTFDTVPVLPLLFSVGTMFWILLYALVHAVCHKRLESAGVLLLILCLCLTCLLGPIVLVRYYLILFFALPLVVGVNKLL